jgi:hypothetical protein
MPEISVSEFLQIKLKKKPELSVLVFLEVKIKKNARTISSDVLIRKNF